MDGCNDENYIMKKTDLKTAQALQWLRYVLNPDTEAPTLSDWDEKSRYVRL